jgi:hypothetical protein
MNARKIAAPQDYRIAAVFALGAKQPLSRVAIECKLIKFAGLTNTKAHQLAGHWFTTQAFKTIRAES